MRGGNRADEGAAEVVETLAACRWAEAGPDARADHLAIHRSVTNWSRVTRRPYFVTLVAQCHGLRGGAARVAAERAAPGGAEAWSRLLQEAAVDLHGDAPNPCKGEPHFWGGTAKGTEKEQARSKDCVDNGRCVVVDCGVTKNVFLRLVKP